MKTSTLSALAGFAIVGAGLATPALAIDSLSIMAPAAPGGGWDQTARTIQSTLQSEGLVPNIQVENVAGAGGTIGLQQFVNASSGDPTATIVGGYVMVGAVIANDSPVGLDDVTPLARLTGEYMILVVPEASDIENAEDLAEMLRADPGAVTWAGGSAGGADHIAAGMFAEAAGVDPSLINYIPFSGGGEALAAILGNQVTVGISGYSEFSGQIEAGAVRAIGITAPEAQDYTDAPTLVEQGFDVDVQNWRMIAAAPDITDAERDELVSLISEMAQSDTWNEELATRGWVNTYLDGAEFQDYLAAEIESTETILTQLGISQ